MTIKAKPEKSGDAKPRILRIPAANIWDRRVAEMLGIFYGVDGINYNKNKLIYKYGESPERRIYIGSQNMNCERLMKVFAKRNYAMINYVRNVFFCLSVILLSTFLLFSGFASAADYCGTPGKDGTGPPSSVINTYYPGTASVASGATSIPVGASSGSATAIAKDDLLLIIQMQDADINTTNGANYGGGAGTGRGYTALNQTGLYEYARATGPVAGGFVPIAQGLANPYRYRAASGTNGQSSYQVIRVPQYSSATTGGNVSALNWTGSVGGIVAMDVAGTLTISNTITADGAGFRGGYGRQLGGGAGAWTDYRTDYTINDNGSKAEGITGTPYYMNRPGTFDGAPVQAVPAGSGYPDGAASTNFSYARGAPGNAGGGSTDGNPANNDQNSGGGGGGNYANGGQGGNSWNTNRVCGGVGGVGLPALLAYNRVFMGGGGGAGTTNNATADGATYANPAGIACNSAGACSSGAPGGGIVILRANRITGASTISVNGGSGYNVLNDGAGGGGAAGSVVLYSATPATSSATVNANGGNGGNAWRGNTGAANRHGPGGGGSGGFVAYSAGGMTVTPNLIAGLCGKSCDNVAYGATDSSAGFSTTYAADPPGVLPGARCLATLTIVKSSNPTPSVAPGQNITYTITVTNTSSGRATNATVTDPLPAYTTYVANSTRLNGITVAGDGATSPLIAGLLVDDNGSRTPGAPATGILPAGGVATVTFQVKVY